MSPALSDTICQSELAAPVAAYVYQPPCAAVVPVTSVPRFPTVNALKSSDNKTWVLAVKTIPKNPKENKILFINNFSV